jgi:two-component system chemotaxis sensor kinase CheA
MTAAASTATGWSPRRCANGVITAERAERLTGAQKNALMFEAGLSTAQEVTAISGRGVGMDVVRANIERIGGLIEVESKLGKGVRFTIRVPLTLTIIPALTVSACGQTFAVPRAAIEEILRAGGDAVRLERLGESHVATIRGRRVPLVTLASLLGDRHVEPQAGHTIILLKPAGGSVYALAIDGVHDHEELVVKPAAPAVMAVGLYAGTTLADDGRPVLLLDPSGMAAKAQVFTEEKEAEQSAPEPATSAAAGPEVQLLLFRALDGASRAIRLAVVERIEDVPAQAVRMTGGRMRVTLDERILPLAGCTTAPMDGKLRILRLSDGASEIAYGFADVIDIVPLVGDVRPAASPGEIGGVVLTGGQQVELIDPYWLFGQADAVESGSGQLVCAIPPGDTWLENMLRPMVEGLGYRVVSAAEGVRADVVIASADAPLPPTLAGAQQLRLRARPEPDPQAADTIYRYDRQALLKALGGVREGRRHG